VSVDKLAMSSLEERKEEISRAVEMADCFLRAQKDTLILTSRVLITGKSVFHVPLFSVSDMSKSLNSLIRYYVY
jgi:hypothetical protein